MTSKKERIACWKQKYAIATMLATNTFEPTIKRLENSGLLTPELKEWAEKINKYYGKRDGYVPRKVIDLLK